jgi:hypothetical protein
LLAESLTIVVTVLCAGTTAFALARCKRAGPPLIAAVGQLSRDLDDSGAEQDGIRLVEFRGDAVVVFNDEPCEENFRFTKNRLATYSRPGIWLSATT